MKTITSRHNPVVAMFRAAARAGRSHRQHLLLDGVRLVDDARRAGLPIEVALLSASALRQPDGAIARLGATLERAGVQTLAASAPVLAAASPVRVSSGVVAVASHTPRPYTRVMTGTRVGLLVGVLGVQDPGNLGAIIRAADAGGASGVVVSGNSADPFGWRALRGAMGSTFRIPVAVTGDSTTLVETARARGLRVAAAVPRGGTPFAETDLTGRCLVLVGTEGAGLDPDLGRAADVRLSVPMRPRVDSLNVAVAAALIIYEARRQRQERKT